MNISLLYIFCIIGLFIVLCAGYLIGNSNHQFFYANFETPSKTELTGSNLAQHLIDKNKLLNIHIMGLNAKKTNYYSIKYNVIKIATNIKQSSSLSALAYSGHLANNARLGQKHTIACFFKISLSFLTKLFSIIFIPTLLICAIINTSITSNIPGLIILISLSAYIISFFIQISLLLVELKSTKRLYKDIITLNIFTNEELLLLKNLTKSINKINFFDYTRTSLFLFKLASPDFIFNKTINS